MTNTDLKKTVDDLRNLQRRREMAVKSCIMQENRLRAIVAGGLGYTSAMAEKDRQKFFAQANNILAGFMEGLPHAMNWIIKPSMPSILELRKFLSTHERDITALARSLHVAPWVEQPEQKGFGFFSLGKVIGEAGDLNNYANPGKLWRRLGCAPWSFGGQTLMGSSWRKEKLPGEEWSKYGYSPRRRSIMYVIGESLLKQNGTGPYRARYAEAKKVAHGTHPEWDWKGCTKCDGDPACPTCGGTGQSCARAHRHGMLLAVKRLLLNLWIEWRRTA